MPTIIPSRIKEIREARKLSQDALLHQFTTYKARFQGETNITKRTLQRIEANTAETETVRDGTFNVLVKLLDVDPGVLKGELPMPEDLAPKKTKQRTSEPDNMTVDEEVFETRLVKLDEKFVIVEFSSAHPTGRIIARDITDEAAGLRLSASSALKARLLELYKYLSYPDGFYEGYAYYNEQEFTEYEEIIDQYVRDIGRMIGINKPKPVKRAIWDTDSSSYVEAQNDSTSSDPTPKVD
jgi:transcriptional regulator with XRE-family HTH domain